MATEKAFYADDAGIRITNTRAIFGARTYVMSNISSVTIGVIPAKRGAGIALLLIGIAIFLIGIGVGSAVVGVGLLLAVVGGVLIYLAKSTYLVRVSSSSGEADAYQSKDRDHINKIVQALNEAIIARG